MKSRVNPAPVPGALVDEASMKLSVNVPGALGSRLRLTAFRERVSESSIVAIALDQLFAQTTAETVGAYLRERGASLRRGGGKP